MPVISYWAWNKFKRGFLMETPLEKTIFHFQVAFRDTFWVRDGNFSPLLHSALGPHLVKNHAGPTHAASITEFICASFVLCVEGLDCFLSPVPVLTLISPPLPQRSLSPEGRNLMEISILAECFKVSQILHVVWLWVCIFLIYCRRKYL